MKKETVNPFLPIDTYIADGEPHVFGDRVYLFGSHDKEDGDTFCMLNYEVWSSPVNDLSDWTSKGSNYSSKQDPLYREGNEYMYAPDCVKGNDGRYYLYYCLAGYKGAGGYSNPISVAVCDTPDGKYEYYGYVRNKDGTPFLEHLCFDPAVINDDGDIHIYFGSDLAWFDAIPIKKIRYKAIARMTGRDPKDITPEFSGAHHALLEDDMLTLKSEPVRIDDKIKGDEYRKHRFFEGSSIRKISDTYYFIYSSIKNHELCYATSKYPDRDFVYGGTIVSNGDVGFRGRKDKDRLNHTGTNHGSLECVDGQWYVFYHRLTHNSDYSRQACAERIEVKEDGSIPQTEITSCGLNDGPLKGGTYPAVICCNLSNGHMSHGSNQKNRTKEPCVASGNGERYVRDIENGTTIAYKYFELEGKIRLSITVRGKGGKIDACLNDEKKTTIDLDPSEEWKEYETSFETEKGIYALNLYYSGKDKIDLKEFTIKAE